MDQQAYEYKQQKYIMFMNYKPHVSVKLNYMFN